MIDQQYQQPPSGNGFFSPLPKQLKRLSGDHSGELLASQSLFRNRLEEDAKMEASSAHGPHKLIYDNVDLIGREYERSILENNFSRLMVSNMATAAHYRSNPRNSGGSSYSSRMKCNYKELIWIKGYSGAGVASLAKTLERAVSQTPRGLLIEGKFDKKSSDEPYSGLLLAIGQIFQKLVGGKMSMRRIMVRRRSGIEMSMVHGQPEMAPEEASRVPLAMQKVAAEIADALRTELGPELDLLTNMIPYLENLLRKGRQRSVRNMERSVRSAEMSMRDVPQDPRRAAFNALDRDTSCILPQGYQLPSSPLPGGYQSRENSRDLSRDLSGRLSNDKSLRTMETNLSNTSMSNFSIGASHSNLQDGFRSGEKRLKYAFRILIRILSTYFHPLVLVQDDLQWADASTLDVLDYVISDIKNTNPIMIVGCYRFDEGQDKKIKRTIRSISKMSSKNQFHVANLTVENFSIQDVNEVLMNMLQIGNEHVTQTLAELVHKRTDGNPHFTVEFIKMLKDEGLLEYNDRLSRWAWDARMIEKLTIATGNVKDLLMRRMRKLPPDQQLLLPYAACWGSCFHRSYLQLTVSEHAGISIDQNMINSMTNLLTFLEENRYIEKLEVGTYIWVHDQVQDAALSLIETSKETFQFEIGCILHDSLVKMNKMSEEVSIFNVADLINQGNVKRRPDFAELNLRAAEKARDINSFYSAANYVSHGLKLLPADKWTSHYKLTLKLYTLGAEVELTIGHPKNMEKYYQEVIQQEKCTKLDKLPLHITEFHKISSIDFDFLDCIEFITGCLKEFGCDLIWSRFTVKRQAEWELNKTRRMAKRLPKDFHETQPLMTKPKHKAIMLLLSKLLYSCYAESMKEIEILCTARLVQMTIKHGVHDVSGFGFTVLGMIVNKYLKGWEEASALAETGLLLQERLRHGYSTASTLYTAYNYILPWTQPFEASIAPLYDGYVAGMRSGNVLFGTWCLITQYIDLPYFLGMPLRRIIARMPDCVHRLREMKQDEQVTFLNIQWQMFLNLTGDSAETTVLEGDVFDPSMMNPFQSPETYFARLQLLIFYGDFARAASLSAQWGKSYQKTETGHPSCIIEAFQRGVSNFAMARLTGKKRFEEEAVKAHKLIAKWADGGCPNAAHFHTLLNAEQASLNLEDAQAEKLYRDAILMAENSGLIHDTALFNERYADFLRQPGSYFEDREEQAQELITEAMRCYEDWGAKRKASMLKAESECSYSA